MAVPPVSGVHLCKKRGSCIETASLRLTWARFTAKRASGRPSRVQGLYGLICNPIAAGYRQNERSRPIQRERSPVAGLADGRATHPGQAVRRSARPSGMADPHNRQNIRRTWRRAERGSTSATASACSSSRRAGGRKSSPSGPAFTAWPSTSSTAATATCTTSARANICEWSSRPAASAAAITLGSTGDSGRTGASASLAVVPVGRPPGGRFNPSRCRSVASAR